MSGAIDRNQPISVTFTDEQWQMVLLFMNAGQRSAAALMNAIQTQCMRDTMPPMPMRANGEDREEASP